MQKLPPKTVERLSQYRRFLLRSAAERKTYIYSHELATLLHITPVQVRRDIMLIGYSSKLKKGYDIYELIEVIGQILDTETSQRVAIIGMGNLGKALSTYFTGKRPKLKIVAAFDIDKDKAGRVIAGVKCHHINELKNIIQKEQISIAVLALPSDEVKQIAEELVIAGVKGILNYTTTPINVPSYVFLEEYDMLTSLEKVAFFVKEVAV